MIVPLVFKRIDDGIYQTPDKTVTIQRVISQSFNGRKHIKETIWSITVAGFELAMCEETLKDAKEAAWRFILAAVTQRIYDHQKVELEDSINRNRNG